MNKKYFLFTILFCCLFSCSKPIEIWVDKYSFPEQEQFFLAAILEGVEKAGFIITTEPGPNTISLCFEQRRATWQKSQEDVLQSVFIPFNRICMVYPVEVWEEKTVSLKTISDAELIPLRELSPPRIALKVDGLDLSDPAYPLIFEKGIRLDLPEIYQEEVNKKIDALTVLIQQKSIYGRIEQQPRLFRIAAGGDVMLARGVEPIIFSEGIEAVLGGTAPLVKGADLSLINLEGVVSSRGTATKKSFTFRFDPRIASVLKNAGFDAVLMANNHSFDYGITGFLDTLDHLEQAGIAVLGAGRNIHAAAAPFAASFFEPGSVQVFGLASYGQERTGWDGSSFAADEQTPGILHAGKRGAEMIKTRFNKNAINIVFFHGGAEYSDFPNNATRALYTDLIRSGADLVIGTHPHVEQGFEWVEGKPVFWSLGDYVFDQMNYTPGGDKGLFIVLSYLGKLLVHIDLFPLFMDGPRTKITPRENLQRFYRLTRHLAQR
ncbi:MAG: CapA family protein [Treponema sp.]|nr:CapA family protein [Treponema sp.]